MHVCLHSSSWGTLHLSRSFPLKITVFRDCRLLNFLWTLRLISKLNIVANTNEFPLLPTAVFNVQMFYLILIDISRGFPRPECTKIISRFTFGEICELWKVPTMENKHRKGCTRAWSHNIFHVTSRASIKCKGCPGRNFPVDVSSQKEIVDIVFKRPHRMASFNINAMRVRLYSIDNFQMRIFAFS